MFCVEWSEKPRVGFPPALSDVFCTTIQTLSTSQFASLNITFFADIPFRLFQKCHEAKISKGFRKWNCFKKTALKTSLIVSIVGTETSVTKVNLVSTKSMYRYLYERCWFLWAVRILFGQIQCYAHALLRGTLLLGPNKGVPRPGLKHLHNKEFSMQYIIPRSKKKNISWEIKMKHSETKNIVLFNQRKNIKVKQTEKKTRQESK